jgi:hypothetical protein
MSGKMPYRKLLKEDLARWFQRSKKRAMNLKKLARAFADANTASEFKTDC